MKRVVIKTSMILLVILLICTFLSKTVYNLMLPAVTVATVERAFVPRTSRTEGSIEYEEKHEIKAFGDWIISEVHIEKGQKLKQGDALFTLDMAAVELELASLEGEIARLESSGEQSASARRQERQELLAQQDTVNLKIQRLEGQYPSDGIVRYEGDPARIIGIDIEAGARAANGSAVMRFSSANGRGGTFEHELKAYGDWTVKTVYVEHWQAVSDGDALFSLDMAAAELELKSLELEALRLSNALEQLSGAQSVQDASADGQIENLLAQIENIRRQYPNDGVVRMEAPSGTVEAVGVETGEKAMHGDTLANIRAEGELLASFTLPVKEGALHDVGSDAIVSFYVSTVDEKTGEKRVDLQSVKVKITSRELISGGWEFKARLTGTYSGEPLIGSMAQVQVANDGTVQETVLPLSALSRAKGMGSQVFVIHRRQGLFGEEYYVRSVDAELLFSNNSAASVQSVEIFAGTEVVAGTTKPLSDGDVVRILP